MELTNDAPNRVVALLTLIDDKIIDAPTKINTNSNQFIGATNIGIKYGIETMHTTLPTPATTTKVINEATAKWPMPTR